MYPLSLEAFREIVYCDTEFYAPAGERPQPICLVMYEHFAQRVTHYWLWERVAPPPPAVLLDPHTLFVAYLATAEFSVFQVLGWPLPAHVFDLYVEARNLTNGMRSKTFIGLHSAAKRWKIPYIDKAHKDHMRDIAKAGGPSILENKEPMLYYCQDDTTVMVPLLHAMLPEISLPHALIRGEFSRASAMIEHRALPVNVPVYRLILQYREPLRLARAETVNRDIWPLYDGDRLVAKRFSEFVTRLGLSHLWPRISRGHFVTDDETLKVMGYQSTAIEQFRQAKKTMDDLKNVDFAIGEDQRNRYLSGLFGTVTSRNNPTKAKEVLLLRAKWWRNLIQPPPGQALAYLDFSSEEFMVQAVLANDQQGIQDYLSGDVYVAWGKAIGLIPAHGDKHTHGEVRKLLKDVVLGLNYGMGVWRLARDLGLSLDTAGRLYQSYRERYTRMTAYGEAIVAKGISTRRLRTRLDWRWHIGEIIPSKQEYAGKKKPANVCTPNSIRNFPVQSNAAEILRLSVILATEQGVHIIGTLHDALLIEAPEQAIESQVAVTRQAMREASATILINKVTGIRYPLRVDDTVIRYPNHFQEPESTAWWATLREKLKTLSGVDIEELGKPKQDAA